MKIDVYGALTLKQATKKVISKIDYKNFDVIHYVVVPDRFSMQAEKLVFSCLGISCTFNIRVVGVSKLAEALLNVCNKKFESVSSLQNLLLTNTAISNVKENLKYYKKSSLTFCNDISKIIGLLKSCSILPENIVTSVKNQSLQLRLEDIKNIYTEYEKLLGESVDANKLLLLLEEELKNVDFIENMQVHFVNFDSLTSEGFKILCMLSKKVSKVTFAMAYSQNEGNSYIYENDILDKLKKVATENSTMINFVSDSEDLTDRQKHIAKNLFSRNIEPFEDKKFYTQVVASNIYDEVEFFAKLIKYKTYQNAKYNSFQIVCSNLEKYQNVIENVFYKYDIPFWSDTGVTLEKTVLSRMILKIIMCSRVGFSKSDFEFFASSVLLNIEEKNEILANIYKYNLNDENKIKDFTNQFNEIIDFSEKFKTCQNINEFCEVIRQILAFFKDKIDFVIDECIKRQDVKNQEINEKSYDLLLKLCDDLEKFEGEKVISSYDFESLFKLSIENTEIDFIPAYVDSVFVGDATSSFFEEKENMIILGASSLELPKIISDTALLSDDDIDDINFLYKIEPTVRMINRRNRLKIFELISSNVEKLFVSYHTNENGVKLEAANFVSDLNNIFGSSIVTTQDFSNFSFVDENVDLKKFLFGIGTKNNAVINALDQKNGKNIKYINAMQKYLQFDFDKLNINRKYLDEDVDKLSLYFGKNTFSASQIEKYFSCPFKHFMLYGLRLNEKESNNLLKRDLGSIYHKYAELLIKNYLETIKDLTDEELNKFLETNFENCLEGFEIDRLENFEATKDLILRDAFKICRNIIFEILNSSYKPMKEEKKILSDKISYLYNGKKIKLSGKVDRVDISDTGYRIIDYKTGKTGNVLKELYFGEKLQLFLYSSALRDDIKKDLEGVFYFDCDVSFDGQNDKTKLLKGAYPKLNSIVEKLDNRVESGIKSNIIGAVKKAKVKGDEFAYNYATDSVESNLKVFEDYAKLITENAIKEILQGYIEPKPCKEHCKFCKLKGICDYNIKLGERQVNKKIEEEAFNIQDGRKESQQTN